MAIAELLGKFIKKYPKSEIYHDVVLRLRMAYIETNDLGKAELLLNYAISEPEINERNLMRYGLSYASILNYLGKSDKAKDVSNDCR